MMDSDQVFTKGQVFMWWYGDYDDIGYYGPFRALDSFRLSHALALYEETLTPTKGFLDWLKEDSGLVAELNAVHHDLPPEIPGQYSRDQGEEVPGTREVTGTRKATSWDLPTSTATLAHAEPE